MELWTYIKAGPFFKDYLPEVKNHKRKILKKNWRNNPADFTAEEKKKINKAVAKMLKDHKL